MWEVPSVATIEIKGVGKQFGSYTALHTLDLTVNDQEFLVLLGPSGCGKTTLLRIIAGLERATEPATVCHRRPSASITCRRAPAASPWCSRTTPSSRT